MPSASTSLPGARTRASIDRALRVLFALLCCAAAYSPLLRAGFLGDDRALLARASGLASQSHVPRPIDDAAALESEPRPLGAVAPIDVMQILGDDASGDVGSLISGWSIALSLRAWGTGDTWLGVSAATCARFENFVWLVIAALGLWRFLLRIFRPWVGADQAARASSAAAFLFVLHPLSVPSVAALSGRADVMALAFGTWAAAAYLRGRQERDARYSRASYVLCLLAGLCGQLALILPFALALAEIFSSYRYRALRQRLWTALRTFVAFSLIVQLNTALVSYLTGHGYYAAAVVTISRLSDVEGALRALALSVEKLGVLILPANLSTLGLLGLFGAGLLGLVALQPALIAARTAPRLWGWALVSWLAAVAISLLFGLHERVRLDELATATTLLPATAAMCSGIGLAATALPGLRRLWVPIALALGFAALANGNARPWAAGSRALDDTARVARLHAPSEGVLLFVDAPRDVYGLDPIGSGLPWLLHPLFDREQPALGAVRVADVPGAALGAFVRSPLFAPWRELNLRVAHRAADGVYVFTDVPKEHAATQPVRWSGSARSPQLDADPQALSTLVVTAAEVPGDSVRLHFTGRLASGDVALPPWRGATGARTSTIDLSNDVNWSIAGAIESVWFEGGPIEVTSVELVNALPPLELEGGLASGDTWSFGVWRSAPDDVRIELVLLDLVTLETLAVDARVEQSGRVVARAPRELVHRAREYGEHEFHFELTAYDGTAPIARSFGALPADFLE